MILIRADSPRNLNQSEMGRKKALVCECMSDNVRVTVCVCAYLCVSVCVCKCVTVYACTRGEEEEEFICHKPKQYTIYNCDTKLRVI